MFWRYSEIALRDKLINEVGQKKALTHAEAEQNISPSPHTRHNGGGEIQLIIFFDIPLIIRCAHAY